MMPDFDLRVCWGQGCRGQTGVKSKGVWEKIELLTKKNHRICLKYGGFYCGGRTRTYDLRVMRRLEPVLTILNPLKCGELVRVFYCFPGNSEQFSCSPTIVDAHVCAFFDGVLEKVLERNLSVRRGKTNTRTYAYLIESIQLRNRSHIKRKEGEMDNRA